MITRIRSAKVHLQKEREKEEVSLWWELLHFTLLLAFLHVIHQGELKPSCYTLITFLVLTYLIFVPFYHLPPFPLLTPLTSGNQTSDLFFCKFALLFNISCIFYSAKSPQDWSMLSYMVGFPHFLCIYIYILYPLSIDGHLCCFHVLAIENKVAIDMWVSTLIFSN